MILAGNRLLNSPVMSLQTGSQVASTSKLIIDPGKLQVLAFELRGGLVQTKPTLLRVVDVREFSDIGMIIDSADEFIGLDDVISLKQTYQLGFDIIGMRVVGTNGKFIGKVRMFTVDSEGFYIAQLAIKPQILARLRETELLVHRSQIREITDEAIVIEHSEVAHEESQLLPNASYINPFRQKPSSQPDAIDNRR